MLLQNRNAVIYGAGGSLGSTVAATFAKAGAHVFLSGINAEPLQQLANEIIRNGGKASIAVVDAMDINAVSNFTAGVVKEAGSIDISFNLIQLKDLQGIPLTEMKMEDYLRPIHIAAQSHFITGQAAGRIMLQQRSGVILSLTATPGGIGYPLSGGFSAACRLIENHALSMATELGEYGIRSVNIRSAGSPDSQVFKDAIAQGGERVKAFIHKIEDDTMLKKMPLMQDIANTALFLASDMAAGITGVTVDVTCGTTAALNYKAPPIAFV